MGTIAINNVTKQYGAQTVLEHFSLELHTGRVVGIVGPNGAGKTTLFRLILGAERPDLGAISVTKGVDVGYLPQEPEVSLDRTLHDEVASAFDEMFALERKMQTISEQMAHHAPGAELDALMNEYERASQRFIAAGGYGFEQRIAEVLSGLGFSERDHELPVAALSGGQRCRAALARLLLGEQTYLLLDEPTNHLDIDAVRWLERFLRQHQGGAAIISHDRYLLDAVTDAIVEISDRKATMYAGNYSNYVEQRERNRLTLERQVAKDRAFVEKEQAFITKHMAGQRTAEAKGRKKRLDRMIEAGEYALEGPQTERRRMKLDFVGAFLKNRVVFDVQELSKAFDDKRLFEGLSFQVDAGQRLGITGPNGTGKSTLLKIMLDRLAADAGEVRIDRKAEVGYYAQEPEQFEPDLRIFDAIQTVRPDLSEERVRTILGSFGFSGDHAFKCVADLSGGEQSRVRLIRLVLSSPNVLVLDEPTNHLDIASREALEDALTDYPGTLIAVSHDRYFLDRIVERLLIMRPEGRRLFQGNYTQYVEFIEREQVDAADSNDKYESKTARRKALKAKREAEREERERTAAAKAQVTRFDRLSLTALENEIMELETQLATFEERFADPNVYEDAEKLAELQDEFAQVQHDLSEAEAAWNRKADAESEAAS